MQQLHLDPNFESTFLGQEPLFDQIMGINGDPLRALEGRRTLRFFQNGKCYYIKQHFGIGWKEIFKNLFHLKWPVLGAETEWKAIFAFQRLGLPTFKVVGYGKRGINPAKRQSFLITEELTGVVSLEDYCAPWKMNRPSFQLKKCLIQEISRIARLIHQHGINHRDFYLCHFLLKENSLCGGSSSVPVLYLIDLHRVQMREKVPYRWQVKDLAGLYFSSMDAGLTQRDVFRFLKYYFMMPLREVLLNEKNLLAKVTIKAVFLYYKTFKHYPFGYDLTRQV